MVATRNARLSRSLPHVGLHSGIASHMRFPRRPGASPRRRQLLEALEDRTLLSATLFVTSASTPSDATHFQTLVAALAAASPGDTIDLQSGFATGLSGSAIQVSTPVTLTADPGVVLPCNLEIAASGVTLSDLTMSTGTILFLDGSSTVVTNSTLPKVTIDSGSNANTFSNDTIAALSSMGGGNANGHDSFNNNTFTGKVAITGNDSADTDDAFTGNVFTGSAATALDLEHASGTTVQNNTFTDTLAAANVLMVHNSAAVVIANNQITANGGQSQGIYVVSDGSAATSADIRGNTVTTTDGAAIDLSKMSTTAALEVRVQGNKLQGNAIGVYIFGDGTSAGNIDLGGGSTQFGAGAGGNDFSSFTTSDASDFAVGIFATSADYSVSADDNTWGVSNPLSVVADATETLDASGSGEITAANPTIILPAPPPPPTTTSETITETVRNFSVVQGSHTFGPLAHFTDSVKHKPGDFTVTITWADGSTSQGLVLRGCNGFDVFAPHAWNTPGTSGYTVTITSSAGATSTASGTVTVNPRVLSAAAVAATATAGSCFTGTLATFSDNLRCVCPFNYLVTITWSDGQTSRGLLIPTGNGTYAVKACRTFSTAGTVTGTLTITTRDGLFSASAAVSVTVNPPPPPPQPAKNSRSTSSNCHH